MSDVFYTIQKEGEGQYREKMSRFLAFAEKIGSPEEAKEIVRKYRNEYHDARHVCWAYSLGPGEQQWQLNDDGEPSGTAGKPILGQIRSKGVTDVIVVVVRYFGGIKLGTSGLISAYKNAASLALDDAGKVEKHEMKEIEVSFPYVSSEGVMKIIKLYEAEIIERNFDMVCRIVFRIRKGLADEMTFRLSAVDGVSIDPINS